MKILILGGGIASISLAKFIQQNKHIEQITILEKDPHNVDPDEISKIKVLRTILGGKTMHKI